MGRPEGIGEVKETKRGKAKGEGRGWERETCRRVGGGEESTGRERERESGAAPRGSEGNG